jgi:hypothetical protein
MAIEAKAVRRGVTLDAAYIVVTSAKMDKYLRPTLDDEHKFAGNVSAVQYSARADVYSSKAERDEDFGSTPFSAWFEFQHVPGGDLSEEAYAHIMANGLMGWELSHFKSV